MARGRVELVHSKGAIDRAGDLLRSCMADTGEDDLVLFHLDDGMTYDDLDKAFRVVWDFRADHQYPLQKATMGLRSMVRTELRTEEPVVAQRFKRLPTMLRKLRRIDGMKLSRMQDIGGCRAVVPTIAHLRTVERRIHRNWADRVKGGKDYIANPAPSGYRGVHIVVDRDGRLIEVRLRTRIQHEWAITVERAGARHGHELKSGEGPPELLAFFSVASEGMALEEAGVSPDEQFMTRYAQARENAARWLTGGA